MLKLSVRKILPFVVIFGVVLAFYYPALSTFFSQDDFFHIKISQTDGSIKSFLGLFGFYPFEEKGIAFYRPVFRELLFNVFYSIFGLNPFPYRVLSFGIHFINIILVYCLIKRLFNKTAISLFTAFFFSISSANVATFYYFTGGIQILGATMFMLLALILFWDYLKTNNKNRKKLALALSILALGSHELSVVTPVLLSGMIFIFKPFKKTLRQIVKDLWPLGVLIIIYLWLEVNVIGFSKAEEQYQTVFSIKRTLNTLSWYYVWALGLPEMLIDFVFPGLKLNPSLIRYWGGYFKIIFPTFFVSTIIFLSSCFYLLSKHFSVLKNRRLVFLVVWFPLVMLPVLLLPLHKSTYYLMPALTAFWGVVGFITLSAYSLFSKKCRMLGRFILGVLLVALFLLSGTSAVLGRTTYWAASRGKIAAGIIGQVKSLYPDIPKGSVFYFTNDPSYPFVAKDWGGTSKQAAFVLNGSDALQLLYKDPTIQVFYEDLGKPSFYIPPEKIYTLVARIR
ncbi:MAG: glycosyltransferase family 39 protein [Candidatus Blackburnbacteria bacterium]|nr:glycosyltransferase family 39 protein [Candidatus Blackburnbacteria bacterium]